MNPGDDAATGRWLPGPRAALIGALWGAAEASLFFLVPDVWLGLVVVRAPGHPWGTVAAVAAGAMAGAAGLWLAMQRGVDVDALIARVPGLLPGDLERAGGELEAQGPVAFLNGPFHGLPVKLYVHQATRASMPLATIATMTALNRIERIVPFTLVLMTIAWPFRRLIRRHPERVTAGYAAAWTVFYAWYFTARSRRARGLRSPRPPSASPPRSASSDRSEPEARSGS